MPRTDMGHIYISPTGEIAFFPHVYADDSLLASSDLVFKINIIPEGLRFFCIKSRYGHKFAEVIIPFRAMFDEDGMPNGELTHGNLLTLNGTGQIIFEFKRGAE